MAENTLDESREALQDLQQALWALADQTRGKARVLTSFADNLTPLRESGDVRGNPYLVGNVTRALEDLLRNSNALAALPNIIDDAIRAVRPA